ncbi:hypothetical protein G6F60_015384 [Rhizopus arrhizus]|nr:hypothetical protein G6F60_015384 [Rhizopus arrhizus]
MTNVVGATPLGCTCRPAALPAGTNRMYSNDSMLPRLSVRDIPSNAPPASGSQTSSSRRSSVPPHQCPASQSNSAGAALAAQLASASPAPSITIFDLNMPSAPG